MNAYYSWLHSGLEDAQEYRKYMPFGFSNNEASTYFNTFEMLTMFKLVNQAREEMGREFISWNQICIAEANAVGHVDYTRKFALYCSELVDK